MNIFLDILQEIYIISLSIAPYLLIGFLLAGFIKAFIQEQFIEKHLGKHSILSVLKASVFGIPLPLCSCSVIPIAFSLKNKGASKGAVTSFLISTPETGVDSLMVTYGILGWVYTIFRPIAALFNSIVAGILVNAFTLKEKNATFQTNEELNNFSTFEGLSNLSYVTNQKTSKIDKIREGIIYSFSDLYPDIARTLLIGIILSGILSYLLPDDFLIISKEYPFLSMLAMLIISVPIYICATASTPIAAELILKGLNPGAALVFLLAGPATNTVTISTVKKLLGNKGLFIYLISIIITSLIAGWLFNMLILDLEIINYYKVEEDATWFEHLTASVMLLSLIWITIRKFIKK